MGFAINVSVVKAKNNESLEKSVYSKRRFVQKKKKKKGAAFNEPELNDAKTNEAPRALADSLV